MIIENGSKKLPFFYIYLIILSWFADARDNLISKEKRQIAFRFMPFLFRKMYNSEEYMCILSKKMSDNST